MEKSKEEVVSKIRSLQGGWKFLFMDESIWEKIGEERLLKFANDCVDMSYYVRARTHQLDEFIKESDFQKEFLSIMGDVYGEHAVEILKDRPNLTLGNIPDVRVFHPTIYENFGPKFINALLNYNYSRVTDVVSYVAIIDSIIKDEKELQAFKFCKQIVESNAPENVYNYTKLFRTYSRYSDLMKDCCDQLRKDEHAITQERYETIKDIIVKGTDLRVLSLQEVDSYSDVSREKYNAKIEAATRVSEVKRIILDRFFGLNFTEYSEGNFYRNTKNAQKLIEAYGVGKIIKYEEKLAKEGKPVHLDEGELKILKIMYAVTMYGGLSPSASESVSVLKEIYTALDTNKDQVIRPADVNSILAKIPTIYAEEINSRVTSVADLERKLEAGEKGISKEYKTVVKDGVEYKVPVIRLTGTEFGFYASTLNENLSGYASNGADFAHTWFEYENGVSHVSASLVTHESRESALEFKEKNSNRFTVVMPKTDDIIAMGSDDIFSSSDSRTAEIYATENEGFKFADEVIADTGNGGYDYNEFVFDRYSLQEERFANKVLPEGVIRNGNYVPQQMLEEALSFQRYLIENGLKPEDYEFPIFLVDTEYYNNNEFEQQYQESVARAEEFKELKVNDFDVLDYAMDVIIPPEYNLSDDGANL